MSENELWELYDLHCHVLPNIDDGCKSCVESAKILLESKRQGVAGIAATPHYYPKESVDQFLARRQASFETLQAYIHENNLMVPTLCLGAEVAFRPGISREPQLKALCYGESDYLLLELPFAKWNSSVLKEIQEICSVRGLSPVIAHLERYMKYQDRKTISTLLEMDVLIQMNAEYFLDFWTQRKAKRLLEHGIVQVLGSDSHNPDHRPPNLGLAVQKMMDRDLTHSLEEVNSQNRKIFLAAVQE